MQYVAILRGINVGGHHIVPMSQLIVLLEQKGCVDVKTYIQSGNVVFRSKQKNVGKLEKQLIEAIEQEFGFPVPTLLRTREELEEAVVLNPFDVGATDLKLLHLMFLEREPKPEDLKRLDACYGGVDQFEVRGRHVYLQYDAGSAKSKLTSAYFDSRLQMTSSARNWRTVLALLDLMRMLA